MQLVTISRIKLVQMISWAWYKVRKRVIINNRHDICNKEYNQTYDIVEYSWLLVINLAKM